MHHCHDASASYLIRSASRSAATRMRSSSARTSFGRDLGWCASLIRLNSCCVLADLVVEDHLLRMEDHGSPQPHLRGVASTTPPATAAFARSYSIIGTAGAICAWKTRFLQTNAPSTSIPETPFPPHTHHSASGTLARRYPVAAALFSTIPQLCNACWSLSPECQRGSFWAVVRRIGIYTTPAYKFLDINPAAWKGMKLSFPPASWRLFTAESAEGVESHRMAC